MGITLLGTVPMGHNSTHGQIEEVNNHATISVHASIPSAGQKPRSASEMEKAPTQHGIGWIEPE
jgi:hypothetical protein